MIDGRKIKAVLFYDLGFIACTKCSCRTADICRQIKTAVYDRFRLIDGTGGLKVTCKDCIHRELCADYVSPLAKIQNADVKYISQWLDEIEGKKNQTDNECEHFADRSRFVELPCKLGDTVYYFNSAGEIFLQKVSGFIVNFVGILVDSDVMFYSYMMGDRFFSTYEEAKQALKEREANANDLPQSDNHS